MARMLMGLLLRWLTSRRLPPGRTKMKHARLTIDIHYEDGDEDDIEMALEELVQGLDFEAPGAEVAGHSHDVRFFGREDA
jgi:hypothetical protein